MLQFCPLCGKALKYLGYAPHQTYRAFRYECEQDHIIWDENVDPDGYIIMIMPETPIKGRTPLIVS